MFICLRIDRGERSHIFTTTATGEVCFRSLCKMTGKNFYWTEGNGFNVCGHCHKKLKKLMAGK